MSLLKRLRNVSPFRGMPVDDKNTSSTIQSITGETVQLFYWTGGTRTTDAGQAAGVVVEGQLTFNNIKNASGAIEATNLDTSLSFTSTALTTEVAFPFIEGENGDAGTGTGRADEITRSFSNGEYCVDYTKGTIYGKKVSTTTTLTSTAYKVQQGQTGGGGGVASEVDITKVDGVDSVQRIESGTDDTGADTYATILTPSQAFRHLAITNEGTNPVTISLDGGSTDDIVRFAGSKTFAYDDQTVTASVAIQAKNASAGNNYTNLTIEVW